MKKYIRSDDEYSFMEGYKYRVLGGPSGDYMGDYNEELAEYYSQEPAKDCLTNDPKKAISAWFKIESKYPMDAAIYTDKDEYARQLCQWVVDNEDTFQNMYNQVNCHYKYDYLFDGAVKYADKKQIGGYEDQIFPFCFG